MRVYRIIPHPFSLASDAARREAVKLDGLWDDGWLRREISSDSFKGCYRISDRTGAVVVADRRGLSVDLIERPTGNRRAVDEKAWMLIDRLYLQQPMNASTVFEPLLLDAPSIIAAVLAAESLRDDQLRSA